MPLEMKDSPTTTAQAGFTPQAGYVNNAELRQKGRCNGKSAQSGNKQSCNQPSHEEQPMQTTKEKEVTNHAY